MSFCCDIELLSCGYLSIRELALGSACPEYHERLLKSAQVILALERRRLENRSR